LNLPDENFHKAIAVLQEEADGNRIYYFANKLKVRFLNIYYILTSTLKSVFLFVLKVTPASTSTVFSANFFLFELSYSRLKEKVQVYIDYDVKPEYILRQPTCLKFGASRTASRFQRVREVYSGPLMPWTVACNESVFFK
jgi:hypothetical protein